MGRTSKSSCLLFKEGTSPFRAAASNLPICLAHFWMRSADVPRALTTVPKPLSAFSSSGSFKSLANLRMFRRIVEYQWFLMALSVRPGKSFAISALVAQALLRLVDHVLLLL